MSKPSIVETVALSSRIKSPQASFPRQKVFRTWPFGRFTRRARRDARALRRRSQARQHWPIGLPLQVGQPSTFRKFGSLELVERHVHGVQTERTGNWRSGGGGFQGSEAYLPVPWSV